MDSMNVQTRRPATDPVVKRAKKRARLAWQAVTDAKIAGADRAEVERLTAEARAASDAWYAVRGVPNPHGRKGVAA